MRNLAVVSLAFLALLAPTGNARLRPEEIVYRLGGVISGPLEIIVNLETGGTIVSQPTKPGQPVTTRHSQISAKKIETLRSDAKVAIRAGLESAKCIADEKAGHIPMPIMDALPDLRISMDGDFASAPMAVQCWSEAANRFLGKLTEAVNL